MSKRTQTTEEGRRGSELDNIPTLRGSPESVERPPETPTAATFLPAGERSVIQTSLYEPVRFRELGSVFPRKSEGSAPGTGREKNDLTISHYLVWNDNLPDASAFNGRNQQPDIGAAAETWRAQGGNSAGFERLSYSTVDSRPGLSAVASGSLWHRQSPTTSTLPRTSIDRGMLAELRWA